MSISRFRGSRFPSRLGEILGLEKLIVDNLQLDGNTLSSIDTNGDINLTPNGTGNVISGGSIGVGTSTPTFSFEVVGNGAFDSAMGITRANDNIFPPNFFFRSARGVPGALTQELDTHEIGKVFYQARTDTATWVDGAYTKVTLLEDATATGSGARYEIATTPISSVNPIIHLTIDESGDLLITEGDNFQVGTTVGTEWGTDTLQKQAWWGATPIIQPIHITDADGTLLDLTTKFNDLLAQHASMGLHKAS